jgi:hypothetical protein
MSDIKLFRYFKDRTEYLVGRSANIERSLYVWRTPCLIHP